MLSSPRYVVSCLFALVMAVSITASPLLAAPTDPFNGATPSFDAAPEEAANYNSGDWGISEQNGAATYTLPIAVPPGRNGMAPALALRYSSNSPLRGGIAAGWTLDIPSIELDRDLGVAGGMQYKAALGAATGRIIGDRVQFDTSNTRFQPFETASDAAGPEYWVAFTPDGVRHYFEEVAFDTSAGRRVNTKWHITRQVDPFGNTVQYRWTNVSATYGGYVIDQSLVRIEYSANANAHLGPHAKVEFEYAPVSVCRDSNLPLGAAVRKGSRQVAGAQQLTAIKTYVRDAQNSQWRLSKTTALTHALSNSSLYEAPSVVGGPAATTILDCGQSLLRYLTQVDITAYAPDGTASKLPPIRFGYNYRRNLRQPLLTGQIHPMEVAVTLGTPGYGQAGTSGGRVDGLQHTLLDIDNDGVRDYVSIIQEDAKCKLLWRKGLYGGTFEEPARKALLPTAAWYREWRGIASSGLDGNEGCTLSGQVAYRSMPSNDPDTTADRAAKGVVSYHFMDYTGDGRLDLLTNVWAASCHWTYDPWAPPLGNDICSFNGGPQPIGGNGGPMTPEQTGSRYTWRVYAGTGNPDEPFIDTRFLNSPSYPAPFRYVVNSPAPLPPAVSDAALDQQFFADYPVPPLFDLDGDGFLDVIVTKRTDLTRADCGPSDILLGGCDWTVYFGSGTGAFPAEAAAYDWDVPEAKLHTDVGTTGSPCGQRKTVNALMDMNGDGLADLVVRLSDGRMVYYRNTGTGFDPTEMDMGSATVLEEATIYCVTLASELLNGQRYNVRRLVDIDGDGLPDLLRFEIQRTLSGTIAVNRALARFNFGDRFGPEKTLLYPKVWAQAVRLLSAVFMSSQSIGNWQLETDFTDVNGDGMADLVTWQGNKLTYVSSPGLRFAPDRLNKVTNGRGMELTFAYAPTTNRDIVNWNDSSSQLPQVSWVVSKVTVHGGANTLPMTTEYRYVTPNYRPMETKRSRFAGFTQNRSTMQYADGSARQVRKSFTYAYGGHPVKSATFLNGQLHQVERQEWVYLDDAPWPVKTTTCTTIGPGMDETACFAREDHVRRAEQTWEVDSGVMVRRTSIEGVGLQGRGGDRRTVYAYDVRPIPDYRVRVREMILGVRDDGGNYAEARHSSIDFNPATGLPASSRAYFSQNRVAVTRYEHDPQTGNLLSIQKPVQGANGGSGARTTYTYDGHKLFVYETANELGHVVRTTYDVATGVLVKREGPNPLQASNSGAPAQETERWTLDGFGRILTHSVTMTPAGAANDAYEERVIERVSYDDWSFFNTGQPISVRAERLRDFAGANANAVWIPTVQTYDGLGRILVKSEFFGGAMAPVATYTYNDLGKVQSLAVPDPSNAGSFVTFAYSYDGLGRVVHLERPDGNGVTIAYAGLAQTITEDTADGSGGSTTKILDPFGRLIGVEERLTGGASAISAYAYDANDNVSRITDADGNVTHLLHDWLGNRTRIVRGARAWHYAYNLNGNLVSEQSPMPPGADVAHYTVLYGYDDLDRLVRTSYYGMRVSSATTQNPPNPQNPEPAKQFAVFLPVVVKGGGQAVALVAASPLGGEPALETMATMENMENMELQETMEAIRYTYDGGVHGLGRLSRVELPFGSVQYGYDVRGLLTFEQRSFALTGAANVSDTQSVRRTYNALGQLTHSLWDDGQQWAIGYDERGLVDTVSWYDPAAAAWQAVADYQRALAGLPLVRTSSYGQTRTFAYDILGRPVTDIMTLAGQANPLAERRYAYTHAGDLASVAGHTNGVSANAAYTYDAQHRLLSAAGPNGYQGNFSYSAAGNILSAKVTWSGSAASRNVVYSYGAVDPQAVDRLQDAVTGATYGAFRYDPVGNMTHRTASGGASLLHWNALGQVRQVDAPGGGETYYYDHGFQRMLAVSEQEGVRFWFGERETHYALDGAETNAYLHLSAGGSALARVENNTDVELQYADTLQNLMFALDRAGSVLASFLYGPFGEVVSETGSDDHRRQFNGKESDAVSGLRYYGYRYYDPVTLRWNSADPLYSFVPDLGLNEPQRMDLYAFSMNNPVRYYDPDGRDVWNGAAGDDYRSNTRGVPYCTGDWRRWCNSDDDTGDVETDDVDNDDMVLKTIEQAAEGIPVVKETKAVADAVSDATDEDSSLPDKIVAVAAGAKAMAEKYAWVCKAAGASCAEAFAAGSKVAGKFIVYVEGARFAWKASYGPMSKLTEATGYNDEVSDWLLLKNPDSRNNAYKYPKSTIRSYERSGKEMPASKAADVMRGLYDIYGLDAAKSFARDRGLIR